jgi:hypothetical protein
VKWKVHFSFVEKFDNEQLATLADMKLVHKELIEQEIIVTNFLIVIAYHRGLLYIKARKFVGDGNIKEWFNREFGLAYATVIRRTYSSISTPARLRSDIHTVYKIP